MAFGDANAEFVVTIVQCLSLRYLHPEAEHVCRQDGRGRIGERVPVGLRDQDNLAGQGIAQLQPVVGQREGADLVIARLFQGGAHLIIHTEQLVVVTARHEQQTDTQPVSE